MLLVVADAYSDSVDLAARRDWFRCVEYVQAIASHEKSGVVLLLPQKRELKVSSAPGDYSRIRILDAEGVLHGVMECATDGRVRWIQPDP